MLNRLVFKLDNMICFSFVFSTACGKERYTGTSESSNYTCFVSADRQQRRLVSALQSTINCGLHNELETRCFFADDSRDKKVK